MDRFANFLIGWGYQCFGLVGNVPMRRTHNISEDPDKLGYFAGGGSVERVPERLMEDIYAPVVEEGMDELYAFLSEEEGRPFLGVEDLPEEAMNR